MRSTGSCSTASGRVTRTGRKSKRASIAQHSGIFLTGAIAGPAPHLTFVLSVPSPSDAPLQVVSDQRQPPPGGGDPPIAAATVLAALRQFSRDSPRSGARTALEARPVSLSIEPLRWSRPRRRVTALVRLHRDTQAERSPTRVQPSARARELPRFGRAWPRRGGGVLRCSSASPIRGRAKSWWRSCARLEPSAA